MAEVVEPQESTRKEVVGGSVNDNERAVIEEARKKAGYKTMSVFVREVMLERSAMILTPKRKHDAA